ncbi:MAG: 6-carboxytetrahydropterin synthase QueD [Candidatus Omnitrophica bacterium]|nr:6-carboxytetrahydropterin synthase QueD [Candidatus Omnitrophota bacterium]
MFEVKIITNFSAAHFLREYKGKCESLHGHNWKVEVAAVSDKLDSQGMVIDFSDLKKSVNKVLDSLDHKLINDIDFFKQNNPSSENIARYIFEQVQSLAAVSDYSLSRVRVWETDTSCATYSQ